MVHGSITIVDNDAVFAWVCMAVWMSFLALMTAWVFWPPVDLLQPVGLLACAAIFKKPRMRLTMEGGWVVVREIWLWKSMEERFTGRQCDPPGIISDKDLDGDPCFRLQLITPKGRNLTLAEHRRAAEVEATRDRLIAAMGTTPAAF
jgi:hypothetical protein